MGRTHSNIGEFFGRLKDRAKRRCDILAPQARIETETTGEGDERKATLVLDCRMADGTRLRRSIGWNHTAGNQIAAATGIPVRHFRKMEDPAHAEELARHLRYWLESDGARTKLVRCMDPADPIEGEGYVRAFLSDRYRIIDNEDLVMTALQAAKASADARGGKVEVFNWNLSDDLLDLLIVDTTLTATIPTFRTENPARADLEDHRPAKTDVHGGYEGRLTGTVQDPAFETRGVVERMATPEGRDPNDPTGGDTGGGRIVMAGCHIRQSETGQGTLRIRIAGLDAACTNRILAGTNLAQIHLGKVLDDNVIYSENLRRDRNRVLFAEIEEIVAATFDRERFQKMIDELIATQSVEIPEEREAVDNIVKREGWTDEVRDELLAAFERQTHPDRVTLYDAVQAMTCAAQKFEAADPGLCLEMEEAAGALVGVETKAQYGYFGRKIPEAE